MPARLSNLLDQVTFEILRTPGTFIDDLRTPTAFSSIFLRTAKMACVHLEKVFAYTKMVCVHQILPIKAFKII